MSPFRTFLLAAALGTGLASAAHSQIREGYYDLLGTNPDGSQYQGRFALQVGPAASWVAYWQVSNEQVQGLGIIQGGVLAVSFIVNNMPGVTVIEVQPDGKLRGTWTTGGGIGTEIMTPK